MEENNMLSIVKDYFRYGVESDIENDVLRITPTDSESEISDYIVISSKMLKNNKKLSLDSDENYIFIFTDFDEKEELLNSKDIKPSDKKIIRDSIILFDNEKSYALKVDSEINFLSYNSIKFPEIDSRIHNITALELKNLFIHKGDILFKDNVRRGLNDKRIKTPFHSTIVNGIIEHKNLFEDEKFNVKDVFNIDETSESIFSIHNFWLHHNGVTLINNGSTLSYENNIIYFDNSNYLSIVNGAQTVSMLVSIYNDLLIDVDSLRKEKAIKLLDYVFNKIYIKLIVINIKKTNTRITYSITEGLNTQMPIKEGAPLEQKGTIKELFSKQKISIIQEGYHETALKLKDTSLAKLFLIFDQKPGKSKNLRRSKVPEIMDEIIVFFDNEEKKEAFRDFLKLRFEIKEDKIITLFYKEDPDVIDRFSENYFLSFIAKNENFVNLGLSNIHSFVEEYYSIYRIILEKAENLDAKDFKNDIKYNELFNYKTGDINIEEFNEFVNNLETVSSAKSANYGSVLKFITEKEISLPYKYRTITVGENYLPTEDFSYGTKTFTEILYDPDLEFENSQLKRETCTKICLFIFNKKGELKKIINGFNLLKQEDKVEKIFNSTCETIKNEEREFVKSSTSGYSLHIKTKGSSNADTIEYVDGLPITKRTFCLNKDFLQEVINNFLEMQ